MFFRQDKIIYQIGDPRVGDYFVIPKENNGINYRVQIKTQTEDSLLFDGEARKNGFDRNKIGDLVFSMTFELDEKDMINQDTLLRIFTGRPFKIFAYVYNRSDGLPVDKIVWQYGEVIELPEISSGIEMSSANSRTISIKIRLLEPAWYYCNELEYFTPGAVYPVANGDYLADGSITAGEYDANSYTAFSSLTNDAQYDYLQKKNVLSQVDRYFLGSDYNFTPDLTINLTNNNKLFTDTTGLNLETSLPTTEYLIKIDPLDTDEWVYISNTSNKSSTKLTWLHDTPNSNDLVLHGTILYDSLNFDEIDPTYYDIDSLDEQFLYFDPHVGYQINNNSDTQTNTDNLILQKNSGTSNSIRITTLQAYL